MSSTPPLVNVFANDLRRGHLSKHHTKPNGHRPIRHISKSAARSNHHHHPRPLYHRPNHQALPHGTSFTAKSGTKSATASTQHVPHNSHSTDYRLYKGLDTVRRRNDGDSVPNSHRHHNSLASNVANHHGRGNTMKFLDESLDVIDGDIPIFHEERVRIPSQRQVMSPRTPDPVTPIDVIHHEQQQQRQREEVVMNGAGTAISAHSMGGTMKHIIGSPLDENEVIEFEDGIEMEEYTEDELAVDPMKLIAAKSNLKSPHKAQNAPSSSSAFPDTLPMATPTSKRRADRKRRTNNTLRSPVPSLAIGDLTPSSVHIRNSGS